MIQLKTVQIRQRQIWEEDIEKFLMATDLEPCNQMICHIPANTYVKVEPDKDCNWVSLHDKRTNELLNSFALELNTTIEFDN